MTHVRARYGRYGYCLTSIGHAETTEACVAVSALVQALAGWVHNGPRSSGVSLDKGEATIAFADCPGAHEVMDLIVIGLLQIEKAAPDAVKIEVIYEDETS